MTWKKIENHIEELKLTRVRVVREFDYTTLRDIFGDFIASTPSAAYTYLVETEELHPRTRSGRARQW
jgi:hypothetical protein